MDDAVRQALARWPDVPDCFGWLSLSRRGEWQLPDGPIRHAGLAAFIGRNYEADADGRWYFQNGPQRVFVSLAYTPTVLRLAAPARLQTHTGQPVETLSGAWLDDEGSLLLASEHGIALLEPLCTDDSHRRRRTRAVAGYATACDNDRRRPLGSGGALRGVLRECGARQC